MAEDEVDETPKKRTAARAGHGSSSHLRQHEEFVIRYFTHEDSLQPGCSCSSS